jgi:hypothetical protein
MNLMVKLNNLPFFIDMIFIDLCLPAVFMPFRSGNVFNPRAYQFFHSVGKYKHECFFLS